MKKVLSVLLICAMIFGIAPISFAAESIKVTIDPTNLNPLGEFEGWGTSLCWWAETLGAAHEANRTAFSKLLFDKNEGLGLSIVRYNIGAGDAEGHRHMRDGGSVPVWKSEDGTFNPDADPTQLAFLKDAVKFGADKVELFSNSPPYYLTESGCAGGGHDPNSNNLQPKNFPAFAQYLAEVTQYIQNDLGINVKSVEPFNEPSTNYWGYQGWQEGCHIDAKDHSALILALRSALNQKGLTNVAVAAADETSVDQMRRNLDIYSPQALDCLPVINVHTYHTSDDAGRRLNEKVAELGKKLYMSEVDGDGSIGYDAGEMGPALWLSQKITSDMTTLRPNAWVLWQAAPAYPGEAADTGYWNICQMNPQTGEIDLLKKYYAFAHYTKFIKEGDQILISDKGNVLAARNFSTGKTVIVVSNAGKRSEDYEFNLSSFDSLGNRLSVYRTDKSLNLSKLDNAAVLDGKVLKANLPQSSITTFVIENEIPQPVTNMGLTLTGESSCCFINDTISFTANCPSGEIEYSAVNGIIDQNGTFTASTTGKAIVTAKIKGTNLAASKEVHVIKSGDTVRIVNHNSSLALQENLTEGYRQCGGNDSASQYWVVNIGSEGVTFENLRSKKYLADGDGNIVWTLRKGEGGFGIVNNATKKGLDSYGFSINEDATVGTYEYGGGANQLWNFQISSPKRVLDEHINANLDERIIPVKVDGTAPYGGNNDVSYEKAFDGDTKTHHDAWDGSNSYLEAQMPQTKAVNMIRFYPRDGFAYRMFGGTFYGIKDGVETLIYTVPNKLKSGWNEIRLDNNVIYDKIIYRTPEGGLCNVSEIEFWNNDYDAELTLENGLTVNFKNYGGAKSLRLVIAYRTPGTLTGVETKTIDVDEFGSASESFELKENFDCAEVFLLDGLEIISSRYIYMKGNE